MLDALVRALSQMLSPEFRAILWKSIAYALALIILMAVGVQRLAVWLVSIGESWAETVVGGMMHAPLVALTWILSVAAGIGVVIGSIFLMPAVTALVGSFFVDDIALQVERRYYPHEPAGTPLAVTRAFIEGAGTAFLAVMVYLVAVPFLLIAGAGAIIFFVATAYLLGREYFELAAMRHHPVGYAKALRKRNQGMVFVAGLLIAAFVSIPIVSLATPLFAMALMVHVYKHSAPGS
ncbi:MAG TPA: sulfate transporter family protein [Xanthobacteraceae bacterium]